MKLLTRATAVAAVGLLAYGPAHTAHATTDDAQDPTCDYELTETTLTITVDSSADLDELRVSIDDVHVDHITTDDPDVVEIERRTGTGDIGLVKISLSEDDEASIECSHVTAEPSETPSPADPSPTPGASEDPTDEESPADDQTEPTEKPNTSPPPDDSASSGNSEPTDPPPSSSATPTEDTAPSPLPSSESVTTQPEVPPAAEAPRMPHSEPATNQGSSSEPDRDAQASAVPAEFRPFAESPRYLLPHLLGTRSAQRGSALILPQPQSPHDRARELETLPPVSEDELEAIKAQLSSPGRADTTTSAPHFQGAGPNERVSGTSSWWLVSALTALFGVAGCGWLYWYRRKRRH